METLELSNLLLLVAIGVVAGVVEATAGGSGLITLPTLLLMGISPVQAIATSKFQYAFGAITAIGRFAKARTIQWAPNLPFIVAALVSGAFGASALTLVDARIVQQLVPVFLILAAIYFAFSPSFSDVKSKPRMGVQSFALFVVPVIGFYDGFIGTGSASFLTAAFVLLRGLDARSAVATTKLVDFMSGGAALLVLAGGGHVLIVPGLALAMGQIVGAYIGASLVLRYGARWVRPVTVVVTVALSLQIAFK